MQIKKAKTALAKREAELNTELERVGCPKCSDEIADPAIARNCANLLRDLKLVKEAQRRIETGEFGSCMQCKEEISAKRLAVVPWAKYCVSCQERADTRVDHEEPGVYFKIGQLATAGK
jgi:DnaK suppressor protein